MGKRTGLWLRQTFCEIMRETLFNTYEFWLKVRYVISFVPTGTNITLWIYSNKRKYSNIYLRQSKQYILFTCIPQKKKCYGVVCNKISNGWNIWRNKCTLTIGNMDIFKLSEHNIGSNSDRQMSRNVFLDMTDYSTYSDEIK